MTKLILVTIRIVVVSWWMKMGVHVFFQKHLLTTLSFFMDDGHPCWYHGKNPKNPFKSFKKYNKYPVLRLHQGL
jgi:hypothetical protein